MKDYAEVATEEISKGYEFKQFYFKLDISMGGARYPFNGEKVQTIILTKLKGESYSIR